MDTYGHLFPGHEADAVGRMRQMLVDHQPGPEALRATGTDNHTAKGALQLAQQSERETRRLGVKECAADSESPAQKKSPKPLQIADLSDGVRRPAGHRESRGGGTRSNLEFPRKNVFFSHPLGINWGYLNQPPHPETDPAIRTRPHPADGQPLERPLIARSENAPDRTTISRSRSVRMIRSNTSDAMPAA